VPYLYRRPALGKEAFAECRVLTLGNCAVFGSGAQDRPAGRRGHVVARGTGRHGGIGLGRSIDNASCPGCGWGRNLWYLARVVFAVRISTAGWPGCTSQPGTMTSTSGLRPIGHIAEN
jgi:hypothetical protein